MRNLQLTLVGAAAIGGLALGSANAMPIGDLSGAAPSDGLVQNVRLVCDEYGRCWRTAPRYRYVERRYVEPERYYAARPYGYAPYGYGGYGGNYWGGPQISFGLGFGPRWGW